MKTMTRLMIFAALVVAFGVAAPTVEAQRGGSYVRVGERRGGIEVGVDFGRREHRREFRRAEYVPGHWEFTTRRVWHEGYTRCVDVPAEYVTRYDHCGRPYTVCVRPAHVEHVCVPGYFETVTERVWVNGYTTNGCGF